MKKSIILEILIIVLALGMVAVFMLPKMMKTVPNGVLTVKISRTYTTVNLAMSDYMIANRVKSLYATKAFNKNLGTSTAELEKFINKYLKASKVCTPKTTGGIEACMGETYKSLKGEEVGKPKGEVCTIIDGGATVCFNRLPSKKSTVKIYFDVNGPKEPNIWGRDTFVLGLNDRGYMSENYVSTPSRKPAELCGKDPYAVGCFSKINDEYWMMKY